MTDFVIGMLVGLPIGGILAWLAMAYILTGDAAHNGERGKLWK